jgi:predicted component of type VI protein secretion system
MTRFSLILMGYLTVHFGHRTNHLPAKAMLATTMKVALIEVDNWAPGKKFILRQFPAIIGRSEAADIQVNDPWVSRCHCQCELIDGKLLVRDLGSRHGTLVNRLHIQSAVVAPGDRLTVGMTTFEVRYNWSGQRSDTVAAN